MEDLNQTKKKVVVYIVIEFNSNINFLKSNSIIHISAAHENKRGQFWNEKNGQSVGGGVRMDTLKKIPYVVRKSRMRKYHALQ